MTFNPVHVCPGTSIVALSAVTRLKDFVTLINAINQCSLRFPIMLKAYNTGCAQVIMLAKKEILCFLSETS